MLTRSLGCVPIRMVNDMSKLEQLIEEKLLVIEWLEHGNQAMHHFKARNAPISQYQVRLRKETIEWVEELTSRYERLCREIEAEIEVIRGKGVDNG